MTGWLEVAVSGKLRNHVQRIARRNRAHREVSINRQHLLAGAGAVAAQAVLILIDGGRKHADSVAGADARDILLRDADQRRRRKYPDRLGPMCIVAVHAGGMTVVVEQCAFGGIVRIGRGGKWMPDLGRGVLGKHIGVGRHRRDVRAAVVAGNAILLILPAQQPRRPAGVVRRMAGDAGIGSHRGVTSQQSLGRNLVGGQGMRAGGPIGQRVDLAADLPGGIVAGQAQLAAGTVLHQKILRDQVFGLHVRIVARRALDVSIDQLHRSSWVGGLCRSPPARRPGRYCPSRATQG